MKYRPSTSSPYAFGAIALSTLRDGGEGLKRKLRQEKRYAMGGGKGITVGDFGTAAAELKKINQKESFNRFYLICRRERGRRESCASERRNALREPAFLF